ncbi:uncharacterized protein LOC107462331 isoform X2 [Arachis duranensis]|uniref:Uncharacterized protein LOC107462331 isoform X2 n=1 Tax=Arachis duranensis TaxID=130453 RepID=A0A9C6WG49_ARADU|nr:uncharacterized protein LOC107462331 isoform X2 [Arachis duranensis]
MAAEHVLELLDTYWFQTTVLSSLSKKTDIPTSSHNHQDHVLEQLCLDPKKLLRVPTLQVRSFSDQNLLLGDASFSDDSPSLDSVLLTPQKLRPILSGKEVGEEFSMEEDKIHADEEVYNKEEASTRKKKQEGQRIRRRRLNRGKSSKSLSDLEFKELKGFMDLGFVFSEKDKDPTLVSLIPGLQRLGRSKEEDNNNGEEEEEGVDVGVGLEKQKIDETVICRPYLSEAWGVLDKRNKLVKNPLLNWRVPALENEIDMKDNLRFWAHTVASIFCQFVCKV